MHHLHHRADQPLDDPAEMRLTRRPVPQADTVLIAAAAQSLAFELRRVIDI
jgi:hypothetical protein